MLEKGLIKEEEAQELSAKLGEVLASPRMGEVKVMYNCLYARKQAEC